MIVGRRGGKSRIAALIALFLACFRDYRDKLAPGEVGTLAVIAADRCQARTVMRYVTGFLDAVPMLWAMVRSTTKETIVLDNHVTIEIRTASFRSTRGYSLVGVICDEVAFWQSDEVSANPDTEILNGLRPGMATIPGALLLAISSPYARRGELWTNYEQHVGKDGDPVLVWRADTASMNPSVDPQVIADAYEQDDASAAAEYGAEFRKDVESFVSRETIEACLVPRRTELLPSRDLRFHAFCDPSGRSADSMTLAICHAANDRHGTRRLVLDCVREPKPPFNPDAVVEEFAGLLRFLRVSVVDGDRYAGEWPRERFRKHGIGYRCAESPKSDLCRDLLPHLNARTVELVDHPRLIHQLCSLERRTARSGKDSIDDPPRQHDDLASAVAGALRLAASAQRRTGGVVRVVGA